MSLAGPAWADLLGVRVGAAMWLVQPVYVLAEVATAARVTAPYSFRDNTISDLGASTCGVIAYPFGPVPVCSPWHVLLDGSFIVFGLFLGVAAILLRGWLPPGTLRTTAMVLWVVSALSSIATGLVPLDRDLALHTVVSLPMFLAQPLALVSLGVALRHRHPGLAWSAILTGGLCAMAALAFLTRPGSAELGGLLQRLALWPGYFWVAAAALTALRRPTSRHLNEHR